MNELHRVSGAFATERWPTRALVALRSLAAPWDAIDRALEPLAPSTLLDVGCGLGVGALGWARAGWEVHAVDTDPGRIAALRRAAAALGVAERVEAEAVPPDWRATRTYGAVTLIDVVYLRPATERAAIVAQHAAHVAPGGRIVVMELGDEPRAKVLVSRVQEGLALSRVGWTPSPSTGRPPVDLHRLAREGLPADFDAEVTRCDAGRPWPHGLVVGTRAAGRP